MKKTMAALFGMLFAIGFAAHGQIWGPDVSTTVIFGPITRTLSVGTAYQATNPGKPAIFTVNIASTSTYTLAGTSNNEGGLFASATSDVATTGGFPVCAYANTFGGGISLSVGVTMKSIQGCSVLIPANWYIAVRQTTGSGMSISSANEQPIQ